PAGGSPPRGRVRAREDAAPTEPRWRTLLSSIRAVQMELKRRAPERPIGLSGNPAAPESAIVVAELRLGRRLPTSYREFLLFSDGWPRFFENADLLGTGDIGRHPLDAAAARALSKDRLLPFGADRSGTALFAFDTSVRLGDGELPVVAWVGGLGLDCRCFSSFLATVLQLCRAELASLGPQEAHGPEGLGVRAGLTPLNLGATG
ncbi:MAG TPA: SMI1/KNR4 family protein, partial [Polyangiaceae bacterium]|nr:SMI1/KNR4 family protein [Polyangiaceae bacterium]